MIGKRKVSLAFKVTTTVCCLTGILLNLLRAHRTDTILSYYTMQSNIFVFAIYLVTLYVFLFKRDWQKKTWYHWLRGAAVVSILLTFFVYMVYLSPLYFVMDCNSGPTNVLRWSNLFVHCLTPVMVVLDYILFERKGNLKYKFIPLWCIFPILYLVYSYMYSNSGGSFYGQKYAYFFLDVEQLGLFKVICYIALITICYVLMCGKFVKLDNRSQKRKARKKKDTKKTA